jgi:hypothetical protein
MWPYYVLTPDPQILFQGDVLRDVVLPRPLDRTVIVREWPSEEKGLALLRAYRPHELPDAFATGHDTIVVEATVATVVLISQTCDVQRKDYLILGLIRPLGEAGSRSKQEQVKRNDRVPDCFYLQPHPALTITSPEGLVEDFYVDFNCLFSMKREYVEAQRNKRVLSMTTEYRQLFQYRLGNFFSRPAMPE